MEPQHTLRGCIGLMIRLPLWCWGVVLLLIIAGGLLCYPFTGIFDILGVVPNTIAVAQIRSELPDAKARWDAQAISNYEITVSAGQAWCMGYDVVLDVRDGEIYTGTRMEHVFPGYPTPTPKMERILPGSSAEEERLGQCGYKSIAEMFELVEYAANEFDPGETYLRVSFDPKYGFVSSYDQDCLSSTLADCEVHYSYHDFEPR